MCDSSKEPHEIYVRKSQKMQRIFIKKRERIFFSYFGGGESLVKEQKDYAIYIYIFFFLVLKCIIVNDSQYGERLNVGITEVSWEIFHIFEVYALPGIPKRCWVSKARDNHVVIFKNSRLGSMVFRVCVVGSIL